MKSLGNSLATFSLGCFALSAASLVSAQNNAPTFYADALPVFQKNCVACHQPGGPNVGGISAPMALNDFEQAKIWAPFCSKRSCT